jgi:glycosyltransferase involved in cell wall biosynthesis
MEKVSIVVPCYNEEEVLEKFYETVTKIMEKNSTDFEYIFIDDGSKDRTLSIMRKLAREDKRVRYISFSRNFGKEAGIYAGLKNSVGDYVVVMDADLQHDPKLLPTMIDILKSGEYQSVAVRRYNRKEGIRGAFSKLFFKIMASLSGLNTKEGEMDYRMMNRRMVDSILQMAEYNRFSKGIFSFVGFDTKWIEQENIEREFGQTKWNMKSLFKYSIEGITAFSTKPLLISSFLGLFFCFLAFIFIIIIVFKTLVFGEVVQGFPTLICCLFLCSGIQLFCFGIMGEYLAKMYLEVKNRPIYLVKERSEDLKNEKMEEVKEKSK